MDPIEYQWIADFLAEKYAAFAQFMAERTDDEIGEAAADELIDKLKKLAE
jgi:hypothetical protein